MSDLGTARPAAAAAPTLTGIGGWLILPLLGLIFSALSVFPSLPDMFQAFANLPNMDGLTANLISGDLILQIILSLIAPIVLLVLMLGKQRIFPRYYIIWVIASAVFVVLDVSLSYWLMHGALEADGTSFFNYQTMRAFLSALIGVCIWIPYMLNSVRVKNTFVN